MMLGGGVGGLPLVYFALYTQLLPLATHFVHGCVPLHFALRDLQKSHALLTFLALSGELTTLLGELDVKAR